MAVRIPTFSGWPKDVLMRNENNHGKVAGAAGFEHCTIGFGGPTLCQLSYAPLSSSETIRFSHGCVNLSYRGVAWIILAILFGRNCRGRDVAA